DEARREARPAPPAAGHRHIRQDHDHAGSRRRPARRSALRPRQRRGVVPPVEGQRDDLEGHGRRQGEVSSTAPILNFSGTRRRTLSTRVDAGRYFIIKCEQMKRILTDFELMTMLAVLRVRDEAYGVPITREL